MFPRRFRQAGGNTVSLSLSPIVAARASSGGEL
jgi:hypothetical protein